MGAWYLSLAFSLFLILIGITTHWIVMLAGLLLLFVPIISMLYDRRRRRTAGDSAGRKETNGQS
jgi:hypothetical protein